MSKNILVPVDISNDSAATPAIAYAQDLARQYDGTVTLLNVVQQFPGFTETYLPDDFYEQAVAGARERLKGVAEEHGMGDSVDIVVREGNPANQILSQAEDSATDIIVIASHDPGIADYFLGSVAARVVRHAHCSVLVVR